MLKKIRAASIGALMLLGSPGLADADDNDRRVLIRNTTDEYIMELYASNVSVDEWQEDMLRASILAPGKEKIADLDDGSGYCEFDFKAVLEPRESARRRTIIKRRVNVCAVSSVSF